LDQITGWKGINVLGMKVARNRNGEITTYDKKKAPHGSARTFVWETFSIPSIPTKKTRAGVK